jgi:SAM-dependent methyltransferase
VIPSHPRTVEQPRLRGLTRLRTIWRLFRHEKEDPEPFYRLLAAEAVRGFERRHGSLAGKVVADLGCGPGYYTDAFRAAGAVVVPVEGSTAELHLAGAPPPGAVMGLVGALPLPDASVDAVFCSNLLEHTPDAAAVVADMARVLKPGGWGYLSWTNWYSPWGGHDMSPYHYLGPRLGPRLYERRHGPPRKNRYGEALFAQHIGPTLRLVRGRSDITVERVEPRYWPWARFVMAVPGLRELVAWNCVIRFRSVERDGEFDRVWKAVADIEGWMTRDQGRLLWDRASALRPGSRIVEIGSYRARSMTVLASAASGGVEIVAIDPHAGNDRGPEQWVGTAEEGQSDHEQFWANLRRAGVADRVRHVRAFSQEAHASVDGEVDLLYIDGAHRYAPARDDIVRWGARVRDGGTMLIHDSYSSVGVTLALVTSTFLGRRFRYVGRAQSMTEFRREPVRGPARVRNGLRQAAELPWFAKNLVVKLLIVARLRGGPWPH